MFNVLKPGQYFITGTDTEVGKTFVTCRWLEHIRKQGQTSIAIKPVSAGCETTPDGLRNEDALAHQAHMTTSLPYDVINPIQLLPPISPNIAAEQANMTLSSDDIVSACQSALHTPADYHLVEGAGGWFCPINERETLADVAIKMRLPVVLVVGMRLGCLNHAILTASAIQQSNLSLAGWIGNQIDQDMLEIKANLDTLKQHIPAPCLGYMAYQG